MIVRELLTRLSFTTNEAQLRKYESGVNNIKSSAEGAANSFRNMFAAFVGFSALQSLARTADTMQSLEARVGMLPQTVDDAGTAFDSVAGRANSARQSIDAYANLYIKLSHAGKAYIKTQEEGLQITDTLSKALVVGGATAQEQSSAMLQFAQAIGSGVLQGDELRAMAEASPMFMDELAKAMGKPREQIKKLGSEGKLTSKAVIEAVQKMSGVFEERFKQMPMTIGQATTIVANRWDMFINRLNRKSGTVTKIADFMLAGMDKLESGLEKMVEFFGGATNAIKIFGIALMAVFAPSAYAAGVIAFTALFQPLIWSVLGTFLAFVALAVVLEDVYQFFTGGESVLGDFVEWLNSGTIAADAMKHILTGLAIALGAVAVGFTIAWIAALSGPLLIIAGITAVMALLLAFKDKIAEAFGGLKEFFGFGGNVNMSASKVAGAATSAGGTGGGSQTTKNITINQELPPGTSPETAAAARGATEQALSADSGDLSRQMALY